MKVTELWESYVPNELDEESAMCCAQCFACQETAEKRDRAGPVARGAGHNDSANIPEGPR